MKCWIDNPHTVPKPETFREMIDKLVQDKAISTTDSPGKLMPVKVFAYHKRKRRIFLKKDGKERRREGAGT